MLATAERPEDDHAGSIIYFFVSGIEATYAELEAKGVTFTDAPHLIARMPDHEFWLCEFTDSEGNPMALAEEKR